MAPKKKAPKAGGVKEQLVTGVNRLEGKMEILFRLTHNVGEEMSVLTPRERCPRDSVRLLVDRAMSISDLMHLLRFELRVPSYEDFKLTVDDHLYGLRTFRKDSFVGDLTDSVEDKCTLDVTMDGHSLDPYFYRKFLSDRCDSAFPLGRPEREFLPLGEPADIPIKAFRPLAEPGQLRILCKLPKTLLPEAPGLRDTIALTVDPRMPIGILKMMVRCRLWIPFDEAFEITQLSQPLPSHSQRTTLAQCAIKDQDTLLVIIQSLNLYRTLLLDYGLVLPRAGEPNKIEIFIKSAHHIREFWRFPERSDDNRHIVRLMVDPTLSIGELKFMLKSYYWIPQGYFVLFSEPLLKTNTKITTFTDDSSTLDSSRIKDGHRLMVCMDDGRFPIKVFDYRTLSSFSVCVSSCFHTVGQLKWKIARVKGYLSQDQMLTSPGNSVSLADETPLVALGIVKPFSELMEKSAYDLKLRVPKLMKKGFTS